MTDIATWEADAPALTAWSLEAQADLLRAGSIAVAPFLSYASYLNHGDGLSAGVDVYSENFIDLIRFRVRLGLPPGNSMETLQNLTAALKAKYAKTPAATAALDTDTEPKDTTR